jgi:aryl-alcohol dehydrogenase-like predicted oxidoreductase
MKIADGIGKFLLCLFDRGPRTLISYAGCTCAQLALAWILKNDNVSSILTGASRPSQITENVKVNVTGNIQRKENSANTIQSGRSGGT